MKKYAIIILGAIILTITSCKSKIETISGYYDYETECVSVDRNGIQTVKAWGIGLTEKDAIRNARRRAVDDILFKGLRGGNSSCNVKPIISDPNTKVKEESYFNNFYATQGSFQQFVSMPNENWLRQKLKINKKNNGKLAFEIIVDVDVMRLKNFLKKDNIIQ
jgi:hypothetical protein